MTLISSNQNIMCLAPCHEDVVKSGQCHCNNRIINEKFNIDEIGISRVKILLEKLKQELKKE